MALKAKHDGVEFGVGDRIKVHQKIKEDDKERTQVFEGMVIGIKGQDDTKTFTVRRIGAQQIGIERIFPLKSPNIEKIEVVKKGTRGAKRAKLYYTRDQSQRQMDKIYQRAKKKEESKGEAKSSKQKTVSKKQKSKKAKAKKSDKKQSKSKSKKKTKKSKSKKKKSSKKTSSKK